MESSKKWGDEEDSRTKTKENKLLKKTKRNKVIWKPPLEGMYKINFDGSCKENGEMAGGFIIRDSHKNTRSLAGFKLGTGTTILAETLALKKSINTAKILGLRKIYIEGDSQIIIYALKGGYSYPWEIDMLIADIGKILQSFEEVVLDFVPREINLVADFLAKKGHFPTSSWHNSSDLQALIRKDALGRPP